METQLYKLIPCSVEKRSNLKMCGLEIPVEFKEVKDVLVVHVRDDFTNEQMSAMGSQLKTIFGDNTLLVAIKEEVAFFVAQPMTENEKKEWKKVKEVK